MRGSGRGSAVYPELGCGGDQQYCGRCAGVETDDEALAFWVLQAAERVRQRAVRGVTKCVLQSLRGVTKVTIFLSL